MFSSIVSSITNVAKNLLGSILDTASNPLMFYMGLIATVLGIICFAIISESKTEPAQKSWCDGPRAKSFFKSLTAFGLFLILLGSFRLNVGKPAQDLSSLTFGRAYQGICNTTVSGKNIIGLKDFTKKGETLFYFSPTQIEPGIWYAADYDKNGKIFVKKLEKNSSLREFVRNEY